MSRFLLVLLLALPFASAHRPEATDGVLDIELDEVSYVVAGTFETGAEVFRVLLDYDRPFALPFEMMVPVQPRWEDHRPAYAVVGPGLPEPTEEERAWLPVEVPEGEGVFVERNDAPEREVYFEQVMRRTLWTTGGIAIHLPQAGNYEVVIWSPDGTTGDFQFGFGVEEDFSGGAWGPIFSDWGTYAW